jgi:hypothetical protein
MDAEKFGEIVGASVATGVAVTPEQVTEVLTDEELLQAVHARGLVGEATGAIATKSALDSSQEISTPEQAPLSPESLLEGFDQAYQTYSFLLDVANSYRAKVKGYNKPDQLPVVDAGDIRKDVEALLANEDLLAELQAEVDYFTANPEADSPAPGFDLVIIPEGLTTHDEQAVAEGVQAKINSYYSEPYIRPEAYNDKRTPEVTGKGYRIVFFPKHYNVPKGTARNQTNWMNSNNRRTTATELQTATDAEALAYINGLADTKQLDNPSTRFDQTYFRHSDQAPFDDYVSCVSISGNGRLFLGWSFVHYVDSTRALVVPKA